MLGLAMISVYAAGAEKVTLETRDLDPGEENASGWAIINYTPPDEVGVVGVTVQIQVSGLLPNTPYTFYSKGVALAEFTTNSKGKGQCHANLSIDGDLNPVKEINIWDYAVTRLVLHNRE